METKISLAAKVELAERVGRRYRNASAKQKRKILDEFIAITGYHPKSAIRVLNAETTAKRPQTRKRPRLYDDAAKQALIVLWEASDRVCAKRLRPLLRLLLPALERHGHLKLDAVIRDKVVRESGLLIEVLERIRLSLPFTLKALDVDNGSEFINEAMIQYCLQNGIEFSRSRPYRKNDQAWIEQKNGAVVRKLVGYRRFGGIAAAQALARLYGATRLFVNFFQPSFKLAEKHRQGGKVTKRYHAPETPYERLLHSDALSESIKAKLHEVSETLDPLKLLEEMRVMQAHMVTIAESGNPDLRAGQQPNLPAFLSSLSSAWRDGEVRPTHAPQVTTRYLRPLTAVASRPIMPAPPQPKKEIRKQVPAATVPVRPSTPQLDAEIEKRCELQRRDFARRHIRRQHAFTLIWPLINRRLEARPNINASELFDELRAQYPGRFHLGQLAALTRRVKLWRQDAKVRGIQIGIRSHRDTRPRGRRRPDPFQKHWPEMCEWLGKDPDQTGLELFAKLKATYPDDCTDGQLRTLQRRLKMWRHEAVQRLICEMHDFTQDVGSGSAV